MENKKYNILVNFEGNDSITSDPITIVKGDYNSVDFEFQFNKSYNLALFFLIKPNGKEFVTAISENKLTIDDVGIFDVVGKYQFGVSIYDENSKLTIASKGKIIVVDDLSIDSEEVKNDSNYKVLDDLVKRVESLLPAYNENATAQLKEFNDLVATKIKEYNEKTNELLSNGLNGSPLVASSIEEMLDITRVYVNTTDGHWYYYNKIEWVDGGVYQATGISDLSIESCKLKDNTIGYDKLNLVHDNPVYIKDSLKFKRSTMHLFVPDLFVNVNGTWKTIKATDFPNDYPTGEFRFWIDDLTTIYYDTEAGINGSNPLIKMTKGSTITQIKDRYRIIAVVRDNHVLSDYTVKYIEDEDILELHDIRTGIDGTTYNSAAESIRTQLKNIAQFDITKCKLMIPDKLFVVENVNFPIYKNSIVSNLIEARKVLMEFKSEKGYNDAYYEYIEPKLTVDVSKIGTDCFIGVIPDNLNWDTGVFGKNVTIINKSLSNVTNKNPKLLFFGDSLTAKGTPTKTKDYLNNWGITATMLGTVKDDSNTNCEGRGNRTFAQYIGYRSLETTDDTTATPVYPFLKVATDEDKTNHPEWCFTRTESVHEQNYNEAKDKTQDFYIFDFAHYLTSQGYSDPEVVIISMSTNDFWKYEVDEATTICKLAYDIMINQILTVCPNCKIGIIPNPSYANTRSDKDIVATWNTTAQDYIRNMNNSNVDVIGVWMSQSTDMAFNLAKINKVCDGEIYNYHQNDTIHPSQWGIKETSKIIASYIVNQL